ncbi:MAG: hypothetical protein DRH76_01440 [Deltaproteobacteria bacterium]|nr:MAG: hypothetical protein DRH76_01440 [Deltaproteobacteria bacterium]
MPLPTLPKPAVAPASPILAGQAAPMPAMEADLSAHPLAALDAYLGSEGNPAEDIQKVHFLLGMKTVLLEIGCGDGAVARQIAEKNPDMGVVATDVYLWDVPSPPGSHYRQVALAWKQRQLAAQQSPLENLVLLRARVDILRHLPEQSVDTVLMIHPEPSVSKEVLQRLAAPAFHWALKPGKRRIVVLPYSRELGYWACGGHEFDHGPDWSKGLGFLMESRFAFSIGQGVHWGVNLPRASRYTSNSTQTALYVAGESRD